MSKPRKKKRRCEGWRRYGGAFTLGPVKWEQCKEAGIVLLKLVQDGQQKVWPACDTCWKEAMKTKGIKIQAVLPL